MKTIKILLGIIAINLTLLTIIQTGIWPPKVQAGDETVDAIKPPALMDVNIKYIDGSPYGATAMNKFYIKQFKE